MNNGFDLFMKVAARQDSSTARTPKNPGLTFEQFQDTLVLVPAECIYKVISQGGDRILFERLSTPRPAPKVTPKSNWQSQQQQQQQSICDDVSTSLVSDQTGQRMIRLVQGNWHGTLSRLLTESHNSKSIFE